mgnify:CR=1 FL=1
MVGMAVGDVVVVEVGDADAPSLKRAGDGCAGVDEDRPAALGNDQAGVLVRAEESVKSHCMKIAETWAKQTAAE